MPAGVPIQSILFTVFQSIFQVFLLCLAGFTLSFKGLVDKATSKTLNHINIALFTPALLFSKVAYFLSPAKLRQLWVIPIFFVVVTGLSALVAHWLARACRLKRSQANFAIAAAMFMNSNSLPVALMQSLAATVPVLKWGSDDTIDAMFGRSLTYLVVFSTLGMILRWSYGVHLLSDVDESESSGAPVPTLYRDADNADEHSAPATTQLVEYEAETDDQGRRPHQLYLHPYTTHPDRHHTFSHLHSHLPAVPTSLGDQSESEDTDDLETTEGESEETIVLPSEHIDTGFSPEDTVPASRPSSTAPRWNQPRPSLLKRIFTTIASLSTPLLASLLALFCVLVPPIQRLLNSEEMTPFKGALDNAGACSVPLTLLVLGGWFWDGDQKPTPQTETKAKAGSAAKTKTKKGKGVEKHHTAPTRDGTRRPLDTTLRPRLHAPAYSRTSSTGSLSSVIGAFGDILLSRIQLRGTARRAKRRVRGHTHQEDAEPGLLGTHAETEHEHTENGTGHASRSRSRSTGDRTSRTHGNPPGETVTIVITLLARMVIVPLIVTPLVVLMTRFGWGGQVFEDPVFIVSSMLLVASPPALTLAQISQRAKASTAARTGANTDASAHTDADTFSPFERLLSRTVFWAYLVLTPPITILSVMVGLLLIRV